MLQQESVKRACKGLFLKRKESLYKTRPKGWFPFLPAVTRANLFSQKRSKPMSDNAATRQSVSTKRTKMLFAVVFGLPLELTSKKRVLTYSRKWPKKKVHLIINLLEIWNKLSWQIPTTAKEVTLWLKGCSKTVQKLKIYYPKLLSSWFKKKRSF